MRNETGGSGSLLVVLAGALIALAGCAAQAPAAPAGPGPGIENAGNRGDHAALAEQYERQATIDAAAARRHEGYAARHRSDASPPSGAQSHAVLAKHCDNLARIYQQAADENLVLAKLHREQAARR